MGKDNTSRVQQIEAAERNLGRLLEWVGRFDNKAAIILGVDTGMLGVVATFAPPLQHWTPVTVIFALASLLFLAVSLIFIYHATYPQTKGPTKSLLFWGSIARNSFKEYQHSFLNQTQDEYFNDLLEQCHRNSDILDRKFLSLKWAYRFLFCALLPWVMTIYLFRSFTMPQ